MANGNQCPQKQPLSPEEEGLNLTQGVLMLCGQSTVDFHPISPPEAVKTYLCSADKYQLQGTLLELATILRKRLAQPPQP